ncbi:hypothetical protein Lal_00010083 [Lupinus albus]|nr:hypothetical protein Lal_00010083 [Lupinus albus]
MTNRSVSVSDTCPTQTHEEVSCIRASEQISQRSSIACSNISSSKFMAIHHSTMELVPTNIKVRDHT